MYSRRVSMFCHTLQRT